MRAGTMERPRSGSPDLGFSLVSAVVDESRDYACSSMQQVNDLPEDRQGKEMVTQFRMEEPVLKSYALYFRKFIEAYAGEGIAISAVHPAE